MNEFVLNGLVKRRAQLAGDIENTHEALRKMVLDLESLDATIALRGQRENGIVRCDQGLGRYMLWGIAR
jgi:hypothetical protein